MASLAARTHPLEFEELDFSSHDIETVLNQNVDYLLRLKLQYLQVLYARFCSVNHTLSSLFSLNSLLAMYCMIFIASCIYSITLNELSGLLPRTFFLVLLLSVNIVAWRMYFYQTTTLSRVPIRYVKAFQIFIYFALNTVICSRMLAIVYQGPCDHASRNWLSDWNCNPMGNSNGLPGGATILTMMIPIMYSISARGAHFEVALGLWLETMVALTASCFIGKLYNSIFFVTYYSLCSLLMLVEARKLHYYLFFTNLKLQETLHDRGKAADAANALEMRHMIANIAHDLKTPLASFLSGMDCITHTISDFSLKLQTGAMSPAEMEEIIHSVDQCVANMRITNSFMLMTINRCIDYTKVSKGMLLKPQYETVDLLDALRMPLTCMRDIQQRIDISLRPIPPEICTHVITDNQWLQENVLCLLSNAVKYSSEGQVVITLCKTKDPLGGPCETKADDDKAEALRGVGPVPAPPLRPRPPSPEGDASGEFLRIEVEDHGIGISREAMPTLFNPFKQAQRMAGGTGLGLFSLAKRLEAMGGQYGVQARRDGCEGSLFWFQFPYRPDHQAAKLLRRASITPSPILTARKMSLLPPSISALPSLLNAETVCASLSGDTLDLSTPTSSHSTPTYSLVTTPALSRPLLPPSSHGGIEPMHVLVVDDAPAIVKLTTLMLKRHRHHVSSAVNGVEAIRKVIERVLTLGRGFDVVLMDLQMPIMDGLEAMRRLRALEASGCWQASVGTSSHSPSDSEVQPLPACQDVEDGEDGAQALDIKHMIIGVSANSDAETAAEACRVGADAFLPKPFSLEAFYRTCEEIRGDGAGHKSLMR